MILGFPAVVFVKISLSDFKIVALEFQFYAISKFRFEGWHLKEYDNASDSHVDFKHIL
jgi:hypothetical protein